MFSTTTPPGAGLRVIAIAGDLTAASEATLMAAYSRTKASGIVVLDFSELRYINSSGVGLLVTLLNRARRAGQRVVARGVSPHQRWIFELTGLNKSIEIWEAASCR